MEYILFDSLTEEEIVAIQNTINGEAKILSYEEAEGLVNEDVVLTIYSGLSLDFVSARLLEFINKRFTGCAQKTQIKLVLIEKYDDNSKIIVDYVQNLSGNKLFNIMVLAELDRNNLAEDLKLLDKANQTTVSKTGSETKDNNVVIYTDGACSGNPGAGGWGAVLMHGNHVKEISGFEANTTNNRMELTAVIKALQMLKSPCSVELYSDSAYVVNAFLQGWLENWENNGWIGSDKKQVKNLELWQELDRLIGIHDVHFNKVKGHADNEYNNRCDALATGEIAKHANEE